MQDGMIVVDGVGQCSPERAAKFGKTTLEDGDLLIAQDGATLGKTAFVPPSLPLLCSMFAGPGSGGHSICQSREATRF